MYKRNEHTSRNPRWSPELLLPSSAALPGLLSSSDSSISSALGPSSLSLFWPRRCSRASPSRSWPGSDETVWGLKFGRVLQKPWSLLQNGNSFSSSAITMISDAQQLIFEYIPIKLDSSLPSWISSYFSPAPVCPILVLNSRYLLLRLSLNLSDEKVEQKNVIHMSQFGSQQTLHIYLAPKLSRVSFLASTLNTAAAILV